MGVQNRGPRTPGQRPGWRPWMAGLRPRFTRLGPAIWMTNQSSQTTKVKCWRFHPTSLWCGRKMRSVLTFALISLGFVVASCSAISQQGINDLAILYLWSLRYHYQHWNRCHWRGRRVPLENRWWALPTNWLRVAGPLQWLEMSSMRRRWSLAWQIGSSCEDFFRGFSSIFVFKLDGQHTPALGSIFLIWKISLCLILTHPIELVCFRDFWSQIWAFGMGTQKFMVPLHLDHVKIHPKRPTAAADIDLVVQVPYNIETSANC